MATRDAALEILIQIRDDLRGITATNTGLRQMREGMASTSQAAKQTARQIDTEFSRLGDSIKRKFSAKDIGMSLLGGAGIGSAFGIINTVVSAASTAIDEHRRALLQLDTTWKQIIQTSKEYQFAQLSPEGKLADINGQIAAAQQRYLELTRLREYNFTAANPSTGQMVTTTLTRPDDSLANQQLIQENLALQQRLAQERAGILKSIGLPDDPNQAYSNLLKRGADARNNGSLVSASEAINAEALNEQLVQLQRNGRSLVDLANEAKGSVPFYFNKGEIEAAAVAQDKATRAALKHLQVWRELFSTILDAGVEQAIANNEKYAEQAKEAAAQMGWAFQSAFEQAILDGKKLSDVLRGLARDIMQIALRKAITEPLGGAIGDFFSGIFKGKVAAAGGGTFLTNGPTQLTVGDNPGGAELVSVLPLSGVGTTRVSGSVAQMAGGGALLAGLGKGREVTVVQNINVSAGVQGTVRAELFAMLPMFRELAQDSVREGLARGEL